MIGIIFLILFVIVIGKNNSLIRYHQRLGSSKITIQDIIDHKNDRDYLGSLEDIILTGTMLNDHNHPEDYMFLKGHIRGTLRLINLPCYDHPMSDPHTYRVVLDIDPESEVYDILDTWMLRFDGTDGGEVRLSDKENRSLYRRSIVIGGGVGSIVGAEPEWKGDNNNDCTYQEILLTEAGTLALNTKDFLQNTYVDEERRLSSIEIDHDWLDMPQEYYITALLGPESVYFHSTYIDAYQFLYIQD